MTKSDILKYLKDNYNICGNAAEKVLASLPTCFQQLDTTTLLSVVDTITNSCGYKVITDNKADVTSMLDMLAVEIIREFKGSFAFKGGYVLSNLMEDARSTTDIDLSICDQEDYSQLCTIMQNVGDACIKEGIVSSYSIKPTITKSTAGGAVYYDSTGRTLFGIDISLHSLIMGITRMQFRVGDSVPVFSIERMLADKISAILSSKRFRRPKDLYDIYCIIQAFSVDFHSLCVNLEYRMLDCKENWNNIPFDDTVLQHFSHAWDKLVITKYGSNEIINKEDLKIVLYYFYRFVEPLKFNVEKHKWDCTQLCWR